MTPNLEHIELGIGTWAWGDSFFWGFGNAYGKADIRAAFTTALENGVVMFDTAEIYGLGQSERFIGEFIEETEMQAFIASKFMPLPWRLSEKNLLSALRNSLQRLNIPQLDLYQIHAPLPPISIKAWMRGLAAAAEEGLVRAVGVSNYTADQTQAAFDTLTKYELPLASNQVKYSLLDREIEHNGLLETCNELGVKIIAYSPLEQGLLTGKYGPNTPPPGARGLRTRTMLEAVQPLIESMREIGKAHQEDGQIKTPAQVALNWCICKGTIPIPGAKNARQAQQNAAATRWRLTEAEIGTLDELSNSISK